jgi:hypothetical protein
MNDHRTIYRITNQKLQIAKERALYDGAAATAINILREPMPDTFLGRKHYDLTPLPKATKFAVLRESRSVRGA